jgi:hypothetical protein
MYHIEFGSMTRTESYSITISITFICGDVESHAFGMCFYYAYWTIREVRLRGLLRGTLINLYLKYYDKRSLVTGSPLPILLCKFKYWNCSEITSVRSVEKACHTSDFSLTRYHPETKNFEKSSLSNLT